MIECEAVAAAIGFARGIEFQADEVMDVDLIIEAV